MISVLLMLFLVLSLVPAAFAEGEEHVRIGSAEEFLRFAAACAEESYSAGRVFELTADLDLSNTAFEPVPYFAGRFLGNHRLITGLSVTGDGSRLGLFRRAAPGAEIRDLTVRGTVSPAASGLVESCSFSGALTAEHQAGGIAGRNDGHIKACTNHGAINTVAVTARGELRFDLSAVHEDDFVNIANLGGIAGDNNGSVLACVNRGPVGYKHDGFNVGGVAGKSAGYVYDCTNSAPVTGRRDVGGIVGQLIPFAAWDLSNGRLEELAGKLGGMQNLLNDLRRDVKSYSEDIAWELSLLNDYTHEAVDAVEELMGKTVENELTIEASLTYDGERPEFDFSASDLWSLDVEALNEALNNMRGEAQYIAALTGDGLHTAANDLGAVAKQMDAVFSTLLNTVNAAGSYGATYDLSESQAYQRDTGAVDACRSTGSVDAESNAGGVTGTVAFELDFDMEDRLHASDFLVSDARRYLFAAVRGCSSYGAVTVKNEGAGCIAGTADIGVVINCIGVGEARAQSGDCVGGIVGLGNSVTIKQNYSNANINGTNYVGGIVAKIMSEKAGYYPYSSSSVTYVDAPSNASVLKSNMAVNTSVIATTCAGRIYGSKEGGGSVTIGVNGNAAEDNRALYEGTLVISGVTQEVVDSEQNGVNNGAAYFKLKANYVSHGWDFNSKWTNQETETYPYKPWQAAPPTITGSLVSGDTSISGNSTDGGTIYIKIGKGKEQSTVCSGTTFTLTGIEPLKSGSTVQLYTKTSGKEASYINQYTVGYPGSGTEADPWRVYSAEDLQGVYKAGYYKQMNDIDLTSWISANSATKGWVPVGYNGNGTIVYDGDNHKITGLWTNTTDSYTGLFSSINNGTIKNLTLQLNAKKVKGGDYTGALIGRIGAGTIENVTVTGNVQGGNNTGGIVGYSTSTMLKNLSYSGQVTGSGATGGITAYVSGQPVTACQVTASTIKSTGGNVGGLIAAGNASVSQCKVIGTTVSQTGTGSGISVAGLTANVTGAVTQCLADATVSNASASGYTAGLAAKSSSTIKECSATGSVTSTGSNAKTGGLVAETTSGSSIEDCYSTASVSGTQYTAGLVGYNYGKVNRCYASGNVSSTYYGSGLVGYNNGASAVVTNCVALGSKVEVSDQSGWGIRVIGGYTNGAPEPDESNYAWNGMQISVNGIPKQIQDNILDGQSLSDSEIKLRDSYDALYWDFENVWAMPADGYPVLQWQLESSEPEVVKGDLNDDGKVSISDVVLIIDVIAGTITDANKVAAADVNGDGKESISDCVAAIDLIATQTSTPSSTRRKANAMLSNTDFLTAAMQENVLSISLASERRYTAFQMTVSVPEGMTLGCATMDEMCGADHLLTVRDLGGGRYLVAGFSADNNELTGNSGRLLTLSTEGQTAEDIVISDIEFATTQAEAYYLADVAVGGTPTGIKEMKNEELRMKNEIYDLQGRRVTKATKGIYMYNGKKTIIK